MRRYGMNGLGKSAADHELEASSDLRIARRILNVLDTKGPNLPLSIDAVRMTASAMTHISGMQRNATQQRLYNMAGKLSKRAILAVEAAADARCRR